MDIFVNNSNDVFIKGFRLAEDDSYKNDAVLTFTVYDHRNSVVTDSENVSMPLKSGSVTGDYRGSFSASSKIAKGEKYKIIISCSNYEFEYVLDNLTAGDRN